MSASPMERSQRSINKAGQLQQEHYSVSSSFTKRKSFWNLSFVLSSVRFNSFQLLEQFSFLPCAWHRLRQNGDTRDHQERNLYFIHLFVGRNREKANMGVSAFQQLIESVVFVIHGKSTFFEYHIQYSFFIKKRLVRSWAYSLNRKRKSIDKRL